MFNIAFLVENVLTTPFPVLCSFTYFEIIFAYLHVLYLFFPLIPNIFFSKTCKTANKFVID